MARLDPRPYPLTMSWRDEKANAEDLLQYEDKVWKELDAEASALPEGEVVGALLTFPVADGKAVYRVTKAKPLTLQHVPLGDGWTIPPAHIRGITRADVLEHVTRSRGITALFGRKPE